MGEEFIGCIVYIDCGERGNYQGKLTAMDLSNQTITLSDTIKNGQKVKKQYVLNSSDIKDLKVLQVAIEVKKQEDYEKSINSNKIQQNKAKNGSTSKQKTESSGNKPISKPNQNMKKLIIPENDKKIEPTNITIMKRDPQPVSSTGVLPTSVIRANAQKKSQNKSECKTVLPNNPEPVKSTSDANKQSSMGIRIDPHSLISGLSISPQNVSVDPQSLINSISISPQTLPESNKESKFSQSKIANSDHKFESYGSFKKFPDKQQPMPCKLGRNNSNKGRNNAGPSGMPLVDFSNGYGPIHKRNAHLDEELNKELMETDFDFNGRVFDDESIEGSIKEVSIRKYGNDENVITDSSRVTTWETMNQLQKVLPISPSGYTYSRAESSKVPVLNIDEKKRFKEIMEKQLGKSLMNCLVAERLLSLFLQVVNNVENDVNNVAIIASNDVDLSLLDRLCIHLTNRKINVTCIGCKTSINNQLVLSVDDATDVKDVELLFLLNDVNESKINEWIKEVSNGDNPAPVITLEINKTGCAFVHTLYITTLTELTENKGKKNAGKGEITRYVTDIGISYSVFSSDAADALADTFALTEMVKL